MQTCLYSYCAIAFLPVRLCFLHLAASYAMPEARRAQGHCPGSHCNFCNVGFTTCVGILPGSALCSCFVAFVALTFLSCPSGKKLALPHFAFYILIAHTGSPDRDGSGLIGWGFCFLRSYPDSSKQTPLQLRPQSPELSKFFLFFSGILFFVFRTKKIFFYFFREKIFFNFPEIFFYKKIFTKKLLF